MRDFPYGSRSTEMSLMLCNSPSLLHCLTTAKEKPFIHSNARQTDQPALSRLLWCTLQLITSHAGKTTKQVPRCTRSGELTTRVRWYSGYLQVFVSPPPSPPPPWDNELELEETPEARCFRADDGLSETPCPGVQKLDKMTREQIFSRLCHSQTFIVEHTCYVREKTQQDMVL